MGSSLLLRAFAQCGSSITLIDFAHFGSSMSTRNYCRIGDYLSVQTTTRTYDLVVTGTLSYFEVSGGSVTGSQASFSDLYASMAEVHGSFLAEGGAVFGTSASGSKLNLDGSDGENTIEQTEGVITITAGDRDKLQLSSSEGLLLGTYAADSPFNVTNSGGPGAFYIKDQNEDNALFSFDGELTLYIQGERAMTASNFDSILHGTWISEESISVSDKRLKENIHSLELVQDDPAWLLRQLRPVSFNFIKGQEGKSVKGQKESREHFGFLADEVEELLPSLVREVKHNGRNDVKALAQLDLIALAVAAQQSLTKRLESHEVLVEGLMSRIQNLEKRQLSESSNEEMYLEVFKELEMRVKELESMKAQGRLQQPKNSKFLHQMQTFGNEEVMPQHLPAKQQSSSRWENILQSLITRMESLEEAVVPS